MSFEQDNAAMLDRMDTLLTGIARRYDAVSETVRVFYVNQLTGSNANVGTFAAPFASLQKAMDEGVEGGVTNVYLTADYTMNTSVIVPAGSASIVSAAGLQCRLIFPNGVVGDTINGGNYAPRILANYSGCKLRLENVDLVLGAYGGTVGSRAVFYNAPLSEIYMKNVHIVTPAGSDQVLLNYGPGLSFIFYQGVADAGMPGRWVGGVAAGTDPDALANIRYTNLGAL